MVPHYGAARPQLDFRAPWIGRLVVPISCFAARLLPREIIPVRLPAPTGTQVEGIRAPHGGEGKSRPFLQILALRVPRTYRAAGTPKCQRRPVVRF